MHPSDEKFLQSKLPKRKLEIALERLFSKDNLPVNWQKTYTDYVRARIYPALLYLSDQKAYERLRKLLATGWADEKQRLRLLLEEQISDVQIRAMLMTTEQMKTEHNLVHTGERAKSLTGPALFTLWGRRLGLEHPALRNVLTSLQFQEVPDSRLPGTDGAVIFYHPKRLKELAASGAGYATYLHMILHCLFFHILPPKNADSRLWDLACDSAVEMLAEQMFPEQFSDEQIRGGSFSGGQFSNKPLSGNSYSARKKELRAALGADERFPLTSAAIYHLLKSHPERAEALMEKYTRDDHRGWYQEKKDNTFQKHGNLAGHTDNAADRLSDCRNHAVLAPLLSAPSQTCRPDMLRQWARAAHSSKGSAKTSSPRFGLMPGSRQDRMEKKEEGQYDFGQYLKRFSVTGEETRLDTDSFDYIPYHYGMEHYGNLPFLEPLEYTETNKVEELVIAIDTSGSCSLRLVRRFLGETRKMLTEKEHFFARMRVHIFQCDSMIQDYQLIHSREEWSRYEDRLSIAGRGGTNFTPVFDRVGQMLKAGSIKKLKGLLYFSDGDGVYPQEKPPYETAFIFPDFRFLELKIPAWIVKICIGQQERP